MKRLFQSIVSVLAVLGLVALYIPQAASVIQNVTIVDTSGTPLKEQFVKIEFPPGVTDSEGNTSATAKTDDDGAFYFDFPGDGDYRITYPGGEMMFTVEAGIPTWIKIGGVVVAAGAIYVATDSDDDNNDPPSSSGTSSGTTSSSSSSSGVTSSSSSGTASSSSSGTASSASSSSGVTSSSSSSGTDPEPPANASGEYWIVNLNVTSNPDVHPTTPLEMAAYFLFQDDSQLDVDIQGPDIDASLSGTINPDGMFSAQGSGTYFSFNTGFTLEGMVNTELGWFAGSVAAGVGGGLPDANNNGTEEPVVADVEAEKVDE